VPPIDHELNLTTRAIPTYGSWGLTAALLVLAIRMGIRERTSFYALLVLAAPTIIAIHLERTSTPVIAATTVVSICFAVVLVRAAAAFLPQRSAAEGEDRASNFAPAKL
jgi:hypothetical protein